MNLDKSWEGDVPVHEADLHEAADQSTSYMVVSGIAELTGRAPDELEPLWDSVNPDALDSFVDHANESSTPYRLAFEYQGYTVEIVGDRRLRFIAEEKAPSSANS